MKKIIDYLLLEFDKLFLSKSVYHADIPYYNLIDKDLSFKCLIKRKMPFEVLGFYQ